MDTVAIVTIATSIIGIGLVLGGWIWDTGRSVNRLETKINDKINDLQGNFNKQMMEVKEDLERHNTMIEPFWNTLCENLPLILKMHNSPDPLVDCFEDKVTIEEIDALITRINTELAEALIHNNPKAYGYIMALAMAKAKRHWLVKKGAKSGIG